LLLAGGSFSSSGSVEDPESELTGVPGAGGKTSLTVRAIPPLPLFAPPVFFFGLQI
jgi:hypothetical protein